MGTIYKLIIEDDEGKTTVYPLSQGEISIGRKEGNTIRLMERNVSRRHARLLRSNGSVFIEDLDSYNGIRINGERINGRYEVKEGDLVEIGDYHLALQAAEIEEREAAAQQALARDGEWPSQSTMPDLPLSSVKGGDARASQQRASEQQRTLVDHPAPPTAPAPSVATPAKSAPGPFAGATANPVEASPLVSPPPRGQEDLERRPVPSFPGPGGTAPPGVPLQTRPGEEARPPAIKPGQTGKKDDAALPTVPISVGPARTAQVPRLVCVSTNYAGKEFALTRPELIIGRVEDNDIVIEHRSVSRNHAKIVYDGRAHKIIDLQSANGILVNGEEYAMTDLRKNDLIELGHVRFRFIPAGETFAPNDEEVREMRDAGVAPPANDTAAMLQRSIEATQPHLASGPSSKTSTPQSVTAPPASKPAASAPSALPPLPSKSSSAGLQKHEDVPSHFDPSTAATVTDTPLSALSMNQILTPQIEPTAGPTVPSPAPRKAEPPPHDKNDKKHESEKNDRAAPRQERSDRSDTSAPRSNNTGASHDQRPTEINIAARPNPPVSNGTSNGGASPPPRHHVELPPNTKPQGQSLVEVDGRLDPPRSSARTIMLIAVAVILLGVVAFTVSMLGSNDDAADRELKALMDAGDYAGALEHCRKHQSKYVYKDEENAALLCKIARSNLPTPPEPQHKEPSGQATPPPATPEKTADADPPQPEGDPDEAADENEAADGVVAAADAQKTRGAMKRAPATKTQAGAKTPVTSTANNATGKELHERARRFSYAGESSKALDLLKECVRVSSYPKCHRLLGVIYADVGDTQKSIEHYKKYLAADPNAPDAARVQDAIRGADESPH